jgi:tol-pal system protein YbgF
MRTPARFSLGLALALSVGSLGGCASTPEPDPMQIKLNDMDERLGRIERVVNNQSLVSLSQRLDVMEAQLREMRGTVEELQNGDATLRKQQRDLYADLDRRLKALEASVHGGAAAGGGLPEPGAAGGAGAPAGATGPGVSGEDQAVYNRAFDALKNSDYNGAIAQFREFLRQYPKSALADNAQYWLGEGYYVTRDYDNAVSAFRTVGAQYPQSRKAPDALLKLGYAQYELHHMSDARITLSQVVQRYPGSDAARLAAERLTKIPPDAP